MSTVPDKVFFFVFFSFVFVFLFQIKFIDIFLLVYRNICCGTH